MRRNYLTNVLAGLAALVISSCMPPAKAEKIECYKAFDTEYGVAEEGGSNALTTTQNRILYKFTPVGENRSGDAQVYEITFKPWYTPESIAEAFNASNNLYPTVMPRDINGHTGGKMVKFPGSKSGYGTTKGSGQSTRNQVLQYGDILTVKIDKCEILRHRQSTKHS